MAAAPRESVDFTRWVLPVEVAHAGYRWGMACVVPLQPRRATRAGWALVACAGLTLTLTVGCSPMAEDDAAPAAATADEAPERTLAAESTPTAEPEPLVTATPDEFSLVGDLVDGFPIDLLPVPRDAVILVTSAVPVGDSKVQQVSLNLRTATTAPDLLELYRTALVEAGFTEVPDTAASDLAVEATFIRSGGDELISIGVLDVDGARTVTIGGRVYT